MKNILLLLTISIFAVLLNAHEMNHKHVRYQAVSSEKAEILQKGEGKHYCSICGMTLPMFYKTNHLAHGKDGVKQYCSIHCLLEDKILNKNDLKNLKVVDNTSLKFIDVKDAFYVIGSSKPATMSMVSKYAFSSEADAKKFALENGGEIKRFDAIAKIVEEGLKKEKERILKKQSHMAKMGEKIYMKICKKTDKKFSSVAQAKTYVKENNLCGNLKGKKLQALGLYLINKN